MKIAIIVAMTPQGLIGKNNKIPWHLPADLQRFKKLTMGHPIVMGRKTFESLPAVLPGRQHIVLTRNANFSAKGCDVVSNWGQVEILVEGIIFAIGGADIFKHVLPIAKHLYITVAHAKLGGDIYFPKWDKNNWQEVEREFRSKDNKNKFDMEFIKYVRKSD